jgi:hypothetical protein
LKISLIHEQLPEIYQRLLPICEILEIKESRELSGLVFSRVLCIRLSLLRRAAAALKSRLWQSKAEYAEKAKTEHRQHQPGALCASGYDNLRIIRHAMDSS